jgi:putative membrane protein
MIVRDKPNAFQLFFILRGSVVPLIFPQIIFVTLLGAEVTAAQYYYPTIFPSFTLAPPVMIAGGRRVSNGAKVRSLSLEVIK